MYLVSNKKQVSETECMVNKHVPSLSRSLKAWFKLIISIFINENGINLSVCWINYSKKQSFWICFPITDGSNIVF